jgi:glutamate dehydrogenase (NAD(P)+)
VMLRRYLEETGSVAGAPGTRPIDNEQLFALDVEVLVLAALENQIGADNAERVRARILAEGANGPVDPAADPILRRNGVNVIPDILCNAGGVVVSYFIVEAAGTVWQRAESDGIPSRLAAHAIAVERVAEATRLRGLYP